MRISLRHPARRAWPLCLGLPAFTLIELLTVIAIIGILAAIVIPTVGTVREKAQRVVDANNLREIIKAAQLFASEHNDRLPDPRAVSPAILTSPTPALLWPGVLARQGILVDPTFWFSKSDPHFSGIYPAAILNPQDTAKRTLDPSFGGRSLAWEFAGGLKMSDPAAMPVAWTRGLQATGSWSPASGVYKESGGYIGFLGGNVAFFSTTGGSEGDAVFTSNSSSRKTHNIQEAVPAGGAIYGLPPTGAGAGPIVGHPAGTAGIRGP